MGEHYYSEEPVSEIRERSFETVFMGHTIQLVAVSGVFSFEPRIDRASLLLLHAWQPDGERETVLDMGCGFGAIGICLKAAYPMIEVTLSDINRRATAYAVSNAARNRLHVKVLQGDLYEPVGARTFGHILSNPPLAAGKKMNFKLIHDAQRHLLPNGSLWLTAYHNKGGETLKREMGKVFGNVEDMEKSGGIRVYRSRQR